jgi:putative DNA primase/helicase
MKNRLCPARWRHGRPRFHPAEPGRRAAEASSQRKGKEGNGGADGGGKPVIRIVAGEVSGIIDQIEEAVIAADLGLYQRAGCVARIETAVIAMPDAPKRKTLVIRSQEPEALREAMCIAAHFIKFDKRAGEWVDIDPPVQRAKDWLARHERMRLPILNGLISAPLILPESKRIIETAGYDEATGLFFEPLGALFPEVPRKPTREDALAALELIRSLLTEFPFADARADENRERVGADESVMLSAIISAIMRAAIGNTPMHCFNVPAARTGKSLAATLVSVISQGRAPPLCTAGKTEEELEKRRVPQDQADGLAARGQERSWALCRRGVDHRSSLHSRGCPVSVPPARLVRKVECVRS